MAVTIKDVAKEAGVSVPVVSKVLHGSKGNTRVSDATRKVVQETAKRLAYRPLFASRSLALRRSDTIGIFVEPRLWSGLGYPYESSILNGVEHACRERQYDILAINLGGNQNPEQCGHKLTEQRIDGLLLLHVRQNPAWVAKLCKAHGNIAAVNYHGDCSALDIINFDNTAAVSMAVEHLAALGHRRIGYLGSLEFEDIGLEGAVRCNGFVNSLEMLGLPIKPAWILDTPNKTFAGIGKTMPYAARFDFAAEAILSLREGGPTAWLGYNDLVLISVFDLLRKKGIDIAKAFSFVGIDNMDLGKFSSPKLTSVSQPLFEMGALAATRLIERNGHGTEKFPHIIKLCAPELVVRESTSRLPA